MGRWCLFCKLTIFRGLHYYITNKQGLGFIALKSTEIYPKTSKLAKNKIKM